MDAGTKSEFLFLLSPFPDFFQLICNLMHETILFQRADFGYLNKLFIYITGFRCSVRSSPASLLKDLLYKAGLIFQIHKLHDSLYGTYQSFEILFFKSSISPVLFHKFFHGFDSNIKLHNTSKNMRFMNIILEL